MSTKSRAGLLVAVALVLSGISQAQQEKPHPEMVVSTQWLADHASDPKLVVLQVGSPEEFREAHVPGARLLPPQKFVIPQGTELPPVDQLKAAFEGVGISDDSRVVIYTANWGPMATRLIFTLSYVGFDNAALLDGGIERWTQEKRPVSTDAPADGPKGSLTVQAHPEIVAKIDDVKQATGGTGNVLLVDARPLRRYRQGHLSGAAPVFWENNLVDAQALAQVLRPADDLRRMYVKAGAKPGTKLVSYCEVGWQATYAWFIARYLGYDAQMYDGSYDEWTKQKQPTVRGDSSR